MKKAIKYSLKLKFTALTTGIIILIVFSFGGYFLVRERNILKKDMDEKSNLIIDNLAATIKGAILTGDDLLVLSTVKKIASLQDIKYVIVTDKKNSAIGHTEKRLKFKKSNDPAGKKAFKYSGKLPLKQTTTLSSVLKSKSKKIRRIK